MSVSPRGAFTRLLPWAALALMVVFFLLQVDARTKAERSEKEARDALHDLQGARALVPAAPGGSRPRPRADGDAAKALAVALARADQLAAQVTEARGRLERAEAVRAAEAARAEALVVERDAAFAGGAGWEEATAATVARARVLQAERDAAQGALAASELLRAEAEADLAKLESLLAEVQEQMQALITHAEGNSARVAALQRAAARGADAKATVRRWVDAVAGRAEKPSDGDALAGALLSLWMDESDAEKERSVRVYAELLRLLPPSAIASGSALRIVRDAAARALPAKERRGLVARHLTGAFETVLLVRHRETRSVVLDLLRASVAGWSEKEREQVVEALRGLLASRAAEARRAGALGLGKLALGRAAPALIKALADKDRTVRHAAAWALTQLARTPVTVAALKAFAKTQLASPDLKDVGEGLWVAQWVLGLAQNTSWLDLSDAQIRRVAKRLRARLDG